MVPDWSASASPSIATAVSHLVGEVRLVAVDGDEVFPDRDLPHVPAGPAEVAHQLDRGVEGDQPVGHPDERDPGCGAQCVEDLVAGCAAGQL